MSPAQFATFQSDLTDYKWLGFALILMLFAILLSQIGNR